MDTAGNEENTTKQDQQDAGPDYRAGRSEALHEMIFDLIGNNFTESAREPREPDYSGSRNGVCMVILAADFRSFEECTDMSAQPASRAATASVWRGGSGPGFSVARDGSVRISGAPLMPEYLQKNPCTAPDSPVLMPERHGFFKTGTVSATGGSFSRRKRKSGYCTIPAAEPSGSVVQFSGSGAILKNPVTSPESPRTDRVFQKTGMVSLSGG